LPLVADLIAGKKTRDAIAAITIRSGSSFLVIIISAVLKNKQSLLICDGRWKDGFD
jgi:hypothetical protein